jgi:STE24 endopeptidase
MTAAVTDVLEPAGPEVKRYQRQKTVARYLHLALSVAGLTAAALLGPRLDALLRDLVGENRWLRLVLTGAVWGVALELLTLPVSFWSGYVLEHRYGLSNQTLWRWLRQRHTYWLVGAAIGLPLLVGGYAVLWFTGPYWWLVAAAGWLVVSVVLGQLVPVVILPLFYKVTRLDDPPLLERLRRLAAGTGLTVEGVYRLHLSEETKKANAALAGLGRTRRVLLGDTLLDGFSPEEIEVVFAHEVGHHVHRHLPKLIAVSVALAAVGFWLLDTVGGWLAPRLGYESFTDPAALPLLVLLLTLFSLLTEPGLNALSRHFERQCDRYALRRTGRPDAFRACFTKLARLNKSDPDPNPLLVWLDYDHPPIRQRLALADEFVHTTGAPRV